MCQLIKQNQTTLEKAGGEDLRSRLYLYWCERKIQGTIREDSGAYLLDGLVALLTCGVCHESSWSYDISTFRYHPFPFMDKDASACKIDNLSSKPTTLSRLNFDDTSAVSQDLSVLKMLLREKCPIITGMIVTEGFFSKIVGKTGYVSLPIAGEKIIGGHATLIVGYDDSIKIGDSQGAFLLRNSWGSKWGIGGHAWIPYDYITNPYLVVELWKLGKMTVNIP